MARRAQIGGAEGLRTVRTVAALRAAVGEWRAAGRSVGLVPTMGALHAGHLSLVQRARAECERVLVTLFVNPRQFGANEDFAAYPRDEAGDAAMLVEFGTDLLFAPGMEEMYPEGFSTSVVVRGLTERLEGEFRPAHFEGVTTVVSKLLLQSLPDAAYFGEKDYQQLRVVTRMVRDLDIPVRIVGVPTVREADGLALSSRNLYLSQEERRIAPELHRVLRRIAEAVATGADPGDAVARGERALRDAGFARVDYLAVCDAETLEPLSGRGRPGRVLGAAWLGRTRLIDNLPVPA